MASSFKFNEHEFKRLIETQVQAGIDKIAQDYTRAFDRLRQTHAGRPIAEIKLELQRIVRGNDGSIADPELTEWAQAIADGTKITFKTDKIRL